MTIIASLTNSLQKNDITVATDGIKKTIIIPGKPSGQGSSVNGGELLLLSLATCFCNDVYREATRRNIIIKSFDVTVTGEFGKEGEPALHISYKADIKSDNSPKEIEELITHVDRIAEIHNTLRKGIQVSLMPNP